ncbi:MAG TPA: hypothetical protein VEX60_10950 [Pyrinomonadaceae bacterium]|nr:hypothetical protein [Pyrinomonadaceae bacterium]
MTDSNENLRNSETTDTPPLVGKDEVTPEVIAEALGSDEVSAGAAKTIADAAELVVVNLDIEEFIADRWSQISNKLRECDEYAVTAKTFGSNMMFLNMAIPLVNGIIHVGSRSERLSATTTLIEELRKTIGLSYDPQRIPVISALTLIYLIVKGWYGITKELKATQTVEAPKKLDDMKEVWERMLSRAQRLCSDRTSR